MSKRIIRESKAALNNNSYTGTLDELIKNRLKPVFYFGNKLLDRVIKATDRKVFSSGFIEGQLSARNGTGSGGRHIIAMPEEFDVLHNILYYLYTGIIVFDTSPEGFDPSDHAPRAVDVHAIYAAADRFLLTDLKEKAFDFLQNTCTVENITRHVFGDCASIHDEVTKFYNSFFIEHLGMVVTTFDCKNFFQEVEGWSAKRRAEVNTKFRELAEDRLKETESETA
jgi:hypothetical protein